MPKQPDKNGLQSFRDHPAGEKAFLDNPPRNKLEAIDRGYNNYVDDNGEIQILRYKTRAKILDGIKAEVENYLSRSRNRDNKGVQITKKDYVEFLKRNNYSNIDETADILYKKHLTDLSLVKKAATNASKNGTSHDVEHLNPKRNGGADHARNGDYSTSKKNGHKSDYVPDKKTLRNNGVPLTKSGYIREDVLGKPVPTPNGVRANNVYRNATNGTRPRARAGGLPQLMRGSKGFIVMDIVEAVDAQTNGAISEAINGVGDVVKTGINNGLNGLYDFATDNGIIGLPTLDTEEFINAPIKKGDVSYGLPTLTIPTLSDGL